MLNFKKVIKRIFFDPPSSADHFDPSIIQDPLAQKISWKPLQRFSFRKLRFKLLSNDKAEFSKDPFLGISKKKIRKILFLSFIFSLIIFLFPFSLFSSFLSTDEGQIFVFLNFVFAPILIFGLRIVPDRIFFDKTKNIFGSNDLKPNKFFMKNFLNEFQIKLDGIYAIQLLSYYARGGASDSSGFYSFQIVLVLKNSERIEVTDNESLSEILEDTEKLKDYLAIPVWNGIIVEDKNEEAKIEHKL